MRMTQAEVDAYQMRHAPKQPAAKSGCDKESELHEQIFAECRRRGWIALHGAMSERTHRTAGEPDFVILAKEQACVSIEGEALGIPPLMLPVVYLIECKTRTGKLSTAQVALHHHAKNLGHTVHVVRSFEEFLALL